MRPLHIMQHCHHTSDMVGAFEVLALQPRVQCTAVGTTAQYYAVEWTSSTGPKERAPHGLGLGRSHLIWQPCRPIFDRAPRLVGGTRPFGDLCGEWASVDKCTKVTNTPCCSFLYAVWHSAQHHLFTAVRIRRPCVNYRARVCGVFLS